MFTKRLISVIFQTKMAQSNDEIKVIPPRAISRDHQPRDLSLERAPLEEFKEKKNDKNLQQKVQRREFFKAVIPASGKILTSFARNVGTGLSGVLEKSKTRNSD